MESINLLFRINNYAYEINKVTTLRAHYQLNNTFSSIRVYNGKEEILGRSFDIYTLDKEDVLKDINATCDMLHVLLKKYKKPIKNN